MGHDIILRLLIINLKEEYIRFNDHAYDDLDVIEDDLDVLIKKFRAANLDMFKVFADYLCENKTAIIQSFTLIKVHRKNQKNIDEYYSRLSNGPMESFNRKHKDNKRVSRGFSNFDYTRNRILWVTRKEQPYLGSPKSHFLKDDDKCRIRRMYHLTKGNPIINDFLGIWFVHFKVKKTVSSDRSKTTPEGQ